MNVELKEYVDRLLLEQEKHFAARLDAQALAVVKAEEQLTVRLHNLNEWRKQSESIANDFVRKDAVDSRIDALTQRVSNLEGNKAGLVVIVGWVLTGVALIGSAIALFLK